MGMCYDRGEAYVLCIEIQKSDTRLINGYFKIRINLVSLLVHKKNLREAKLYDRLCNGIVYEV